MGSRSSRKKRASRPARPPSFGEAAAPPARPAAPAEPEAQPADRMRRGYARAEARNEEIRQNLEPLAPGERPGAVTIAAIVALLLAIGNTVTIFIGDVADDEQARVVQIAGTVVLLAAAAGMWKARYWAVLGFQALLTLQLIICFLALLGTSDLWAAAVLVALVGLGGWLFWKLVRAMARLQMPVR